MPVELEDADVRAELLSERRGKKVEFLVPQRGEKLRLLEMAMDNARQSFAARRDNENTRERMLEELRAQAPSAQQPQAHRVLRHLQSAGLDGGRIAGDLRRRPAAQGSLSPLPDSHRRGPGRFRQHVRGAEPAPQARARPRTNIPTCGSSTAAKANSMWRLRCCGSRAARSDRRHLARQAACAERSSRARGGQIRGARVPA